MTAPIVLKRSKSSVNARGEIISRHSADEHIYTFIAINTNGFLGGGVLEVVVTVGEGPIAGSFDLFRQDALVADAHEVGPGDSHPLGYGGCDFGPGQVFQLRAEGDWRLFTTERFKNTFTVRANVRALSGPVSEGKEARIEELLARMEERGVNVAPLEKLYQQLIAKARTVEQPRDLPEGVHGWLVAIGVEDFPTADAEALQKWRHNLEDKVQSFWITLLETEDPDRVVKGLRDWLHAFSQFDAAAQLSSQAAIESLMASQQLVQDVMETLPLVSEAMMIYEVAAGSSSLTGKQLSDAERLLKLGMLLSPLALDRIFKRLGGKADAMAEELEELTEHVQTDAVLRTRMAEATQKSEQELLEEAEKLSTSFDEAAALKGPRPGLRTEPMAELFEDMAEKIKGPGGEQLREDMAKALKLTKEEIPDDPAKLRAVFESATAVKGGKAWEFYVILRDGGEDLNKAFNKNSLIVDEFVKVSGKFASIARTGEEAASGYLRSKFLKLFEVGTSTYNKMLKDLSKFRVPVATAEEFIEKAELVVPTEAQKKALLDWIGENSATPEALISWLGKDVYDVLSKIKPNHNEVVSHLRGMVRSLK